MNADQFLDHYGEGALPIEQTLKDWRERALGDLLGQEMAPGVPVADYLTGGAPVDAIPPNMLKPGDVLSGQAGNNSGIDVDLVPEAFGPGEECSLNHCFEQVSSDTVMTAAPQAAVIGLLLYKEAKTLDQEFGNIAMSSAMTSATYLGGFAARMLTNSALSTFTNLSGPLGIAVGIGARRVLNSFVRGRLSLAQRLELAAEDLDRKIDKLQGRANSSFDA